MQIKRNFVTKVGLSNDERCWFAICVRRNTGVAKKNY